MTIFENNVISVIHIMYGKKMLKNIRHPAHYWSAVFCLLSVTDRQTKSNTIDQCSYLIFLVSNQGTISYELFHSSGTPCTRLYFSTLIHFVVSVILASKNLYWQKFTVQRAKKRRNILSFGLMGEWILGISKRIRFYSRFNESTPDSYGFDIQLY